MNHACIALRRVTGRCTYDVLAELIESVIAEYGLSNKISHCITDSGSNFVKAFKEYAVIKDDDDPDINAEDDNDDSDERVEPVALDDLLNEAPAEPDYTLPLHFRCAVHRLNLIGSTDAEVALENPICKRIFRSLMAKLTTVFNKQTRSTLASDKIQETLGELFTVHNSTRWNSLYDALSRVNRLLLEKSAELQNVFAEFDLRPITTEEGEFLAEYIEAMTPLATSLDLLQGENVGIGYLLPAIYDILEQWQAQLLQPRKYTAGLLVHLVASLRRRFSQEMDSDDFIIAAVIHPMFRIHWAVGDMKDRAISAARKELAKYSSEKLPQEQEGNHPDSDQQPPNKKSLLNRILEKATEASSCNECIANQWMSWSIQRPSSVVPDWLTKAYIDYNTSLPSSAPVERLFSLGKRVLQPLQTRLAPQTFESMMVIAFNASKSKPV